MKIEDMKVTIEVMGIHMKEQEETFSRMQVLEGMKVRNEVNNIPSSKGEGIRVFHKKESDPLEGIIARKCKEDDQLDSYLYIRVSFFRIFLWLVMQLPLLKL